MTNPLLRTLSDLIRAEDDDFDLTEALETLRDVSQEFAHPIEVVRMLDKLEKRCKEIVRDTGDITGVKGLDVNFYPPKQKVRKSVPVANIPILERLAEEHDLPEILDCIQEKEASPSVRFKME